MEPDEGAVRGFLIAAPDPSLAGHPAGPPLRWRIWWFRVHGGDRRECVPEGFRDAVGCRGGRREGCASQ